MSVPIDSYGRAAAAYMRAARGEPASETGAGSGHSFADMLKGVVDEAITSGIDSEKASVAAVGQGADLNHVVTAVARGGGDAADGRSRPRTYYRGVQGHPAHGDLTASGMGE